MMPPVINNSSNKVAPFLFVIVVSILCIKNFPPLDKILFIMLDNEVSLYKQKTEDNTFWNVSSVLG